MNQFPQTLRHLRKQAGMTQPELAQRLGISRSAVSMYESGLREPNFAMMEAFADLFGVDMNALTGRGAEPRRATDEELKFALFGEADIDDALYQEVLAFAEFAKRRRKE